MWSKDPRTVRLSSLALPYLVAEASGRIPAASRRASPGASGPPRSLISSSARVRVGRGFPQASRGASAPPRPGPAGVDPGAARAYVESDAPAARTKHGPSPGRSGCLQRDDDGRMVRCRSLPRRPCRCGLDCWGRRPVLDRSVRHGALAPEPPARRQRFRPRSRPRADPIGGSDPHGRQA
jgi:hypothetical protein